MVRPRYVSYCHSVFSSKGQTVGYSGLPYSESASSLLPLEDPPSGCWFVFSMRRRFAARLVAPGAPDPDPEPYSSSDESPRAPIPGLLPASEGLPRDVAREEAIDLLDAEECRIRWLALCCLALSASSSSSSCSASRSSCLALSRPPFSSGRVQSEVMTSSSA